jgi:hypothetical protein
MDSLGAGFGALGASSVRSHIRGTYFVSASQPRVRDYDAQAGAATNCAVTAQLAAIVLVSSPTFSTAIFTMSPGRRNTGGVL